MKKHHNANFNGRFPKPDIFFYFSHFSLNCGEKINVYCSNMR